MTTFNGLYLIVSCKRDKSLVYLASREKKNNLIIKGTLGTKFLIL